MKRQPMPGKAKDAPLRAQTLVVSPCVRVCKLDAENICTGCARTLDEIARWSRMTDAERQVVMERVAPSRAESAK